MRAPSTARTPETDEPSNAYVPPDNGSAFNGRPGAEALSNHKDRSARPVRCSAGLSRRLTPKADDVAVRVLDVEVLRAPFRRRQRLEDFRSVGNALLVEGVNPLHAGGG